MMTFANQQIIYAFALYALVVLVPYIIFCKIQPTIFSAWKVDLINKQHAETHEIRSTITSFIVLYGILIFGGFLQEKSVLTFKEDLPTWYYLLSFPLVVLVHDTYFYWTHYLMHRSKFLYRFHKDHHIAHEATPLDVYAFHPVEAFVHFIFFVIYPLVIPSNLQTIQFMFVWMLVCNSAGHLSYEFYPKFLYDFPVIRQFNAATHHLMHHKYYNSNFSLYYNWWDRWMGTNHKDYFKTYKKVKGEVQTKLYLSHQLNSSSSSPGILVQSLESGLSLDEIPQSKIVLHS